MARADSMIPSREIVEARLLKEQRRYHYLRLLIITLCLLATVAAAAALIAILFLQILRIDGTSMADTLRESDLVVAYSASSFEKGDIIAFYQEEDILVKRIIATEGDIVDIGPDGSVYVNGQLLEEPYVKQKALGGCDIELPCQVPEGESFVLGDHRNVSIDSRSSAIGCIRDSEIIGKVFLRIWPVKEIGPLK